mmetsp:Transcript_17252/g.37750  ORF Transcript_17252/g.37750 Transcript_17252/m.37750 type:complete len:130 (+) Transcript_17252:99-488(+)
MTIYLNIDLKKGILSICLWVLKRVVLAYKNHNSSLGSIDDDLLERIWAETNTVSLVELALEFNPVQTKGMEETFQNIHHQQDAEGDTSKKSKTNVGSKPVNFKGTEHALFPKDSSKFGVGKRKSPKTKV